MYSPRYSRPHTAVCLISIVNTPTQSNSSNSSTRQDPVTVLTFAVVVVNVGNVLLLDVNVMTGWLVDCCFSLDLWPWNRSQRPENNCNSIEWLAPTTRERQVCCLFSYGVHLPVDYYLVVYSDEQSRVTKSLTETEVCLLSYCVILVSSNVWHRVYHQTEKEQLRVEVVGIKDALIDLKSELEVCGAGMLFCCYFCHIHLLQASRGEEIDLRNQLEVALLENDQLKWVEWDPFVCLYVSLFIHGCLLISVSGYYWYLFVFSLHPFTSLHFKVWRSMSLCPLFVSLFAWSLVSLCVWCLLHFVF